MTANHSPLITHRSPFTIEKKDQGRSQVGLALVFSADPKIRSASFSLPGRTQPKGGTPLFSGSALIRVAGPADGVGDNGGEQVLMQRTGVFTRFFTCLPYTQDGPSSIVHSAASDGGIAGISITRRPPRRTPFLG